jgi:hypothetical protein
MDYSENNQNKKKWRLSHTMKIYLLTLLITYGVVPSIIVLVIRNLGNLKFMPHTFRNKQKPISLELAGMISLLLLIIYVFFLYIFWKKRNHPLINYRPILLCINTGFWSGVYNVLLPIVLAITEKRKKESIDNTSLCLIPLILTILLAPMSMMSNLSRYVKLFLLNKRDVSRLKLFNEKQNSSFPINNNGFEPNMYVKRLNKLVSRQITIRLFIIPYIILISLGGVIISYKYFSDKYNDQCQDVNHYIYLEDGRKIKDDNSNCGLCNQGFILYAPILFLSLITSFIIPYIYIKLYHVLNFVNKLDIILHLLGLYAGTFLFISTLFSISYKNAIVNENSESNIRFYLLSRMKNNQLFFIIPGFVSFICAVIIPLIEVWYFDKKIKDKKLLTKMEFTKLLMKSNYIDSLKSLAVKSYCVEVILFWDVHMKLMKQVYNEYIKIYEEKQSLYNPVNPSYKSPIGRGDSDPRIGNCNNNHYNNINNNYNNSNDNYNSNYNSNDGNYYNNGSNKNNSLTKKSGKTISSPHQSNNDLLLNLNKNIFGRDNERILYAGCGSNSINSNLSDLINNIVDESSYHQINYYESQTESTILSSSSISRSGSNQNREYSLDDMDHNLHYQRLPSNTLFDSSFPYNSKSYMNQGNDNGGYDDNKCLHKINSLQSSHSTLSPLPYVSYSEVMNSDKAGLLNHSEFHNLNNMNDSTHDIINASKRNGSLNRMTSSYNQINRKNPNYDGHTDIYYELFNVNPEEVELPKEFWSEFNKVYHSFISDKSLATVNLDDNISIKLDQAIKYERYTIDMFFPAIAETVNLIYQNLYPKIFFN